MRARKQVLIALGLLLLGLALWLRTRSTPPVATAAAPGAAELALQPSAAAVHTADTPAGRAGGAGAPVRSAPTARRLSPQRQQQRQRVVRTLREREQKRAAAAAGPAASSAAEADQAGTLVDKTGKLTEAELRVLNHELMPMISQCLDQAHERDPQLKGMLAVVLQFASAEELGSIVETVEPAASNDLGDEELLECVRQSAFTLDFPVPGKDGRSDGMLTIPFGIDPKDWRPRDGAAEQPPAASPAR